VQEHLDALRREGRLPEKTRRARRRVLCDEATPIAEAQEPLVELHRVLCRLAGRDLGRAETEQILFALRPLFGS
jgi:hypothetical protein